MQQSGVPGLAKTLLVSRLAGVLVACSAALPFTPDLMPMDIAGADVCRMLAERPGLDWPKDPVWQTWCWPTTDRASKTQAAICCLKAMQEHRVTVASRRSLSAPFSLATKTRSSQRPTHSYPSRQPLMS